MNLVDKSNKCSGCSLCSLICPKSAINMEMVNGFYRPVIDYNACVHCGLCMQNCHLLSESISKDNNYKPKIYACRNKNKDELKKSTSGGVFFLLAESFIKQGGFVCGAIYTNDFKTVEHVISNDIEIVKKMREAKYVQSYVQTAFKKIREMVKDNKMVLFCGTPCQNYALSKIIPPSKRDNVLFIDIVCHGYPSPLAWEEFITFLNDTKGVVDRFSFRDKSFGWKGVNCVASFNGSNKYHHNSALISSYSNLYFGHHITASGCSECKFSTFPRYSSDITLGDFWGIEKTPYYRFHDNKGVSLVIINTNKGFSAFEQLSDKIEFEETIFDYCKQPQLLCPPQISSSSYEVMSLINKNQFKTAIKKYGGYSFLGRVKHLARRIIRMFN